MDYLCAIYFIPVRYPSKICDQLNHETVKAAAVRLIIDKSEENNLGELDTDYKILHQTLLIIKIPVMKVTYEYQTKEYTGWFFGDNKLFRTRKSNI